MSAGEISNPKLSMAICVSCHPRPGMMIQCVAWVVVLLVVIASLGSLAAQVTNQAPTSTAPAPEDFGQFIVDHQDDLSPFFSKNSDAFMKEAWPVVLSLFGRIMFVTVIAAWAIDVLLGRCYSAFFAPAFAKLKRALFYASGGLLISFTFTLLFGLAIGAISATVGTGILIGVAAAVIVLMGFAAQIGWVRYLYRTDLKTSAVFYVCIFLVHFLILLLVSAPLIGSHATEMITTFVDQSITPRLKDEVQAQKHDLAAANASLDKVKAQIAEVQDRLGQARTEQTELQKEIDEKKNAEDYVFAQIMKVQAKDDLAAARDQLNDFMVKFPNGAMAAAAQAQLTMVNNGIAAREAREKQALADAERDAALARADLLARADKGEVTLSEMRQAVLGKTPREISALFGPPTETASNRWGFGKKMIVNPLTNEKFGLAIYFTEGVVQSVDYYYGVSP